MANTALRVVGDEKRPVGRPPGQPRTGGRKKGVPNKVTRNVREMILERGRPVEFLCDISRGKKIRIGPQAGPGEPQFYYPTPSDRIAAARDLMPFVVAKMQQLTGADNEPLIPQPDRDTDVDQRQLARAILDVLCAGAPGGSVKIVESDAAEPPQHDIDSGNHVMGMGKHQNSDPPDVSPESQDCEVGQRFLIGSKGSEIVSVENEFGARKFAVYDGFGVLHNFRRSRADAEALAEILPGPENETGGEQ